MSNKEKNKQKQSYNTPECRVYSIKTEGIVCDSGDADTNDYDKETW